MGNFLKGVLKVLNPLPSLIKANKAADGNIGKILWNFINPAGTQIRDNTGELDLVLSPEYKQAQEYWAKKAAGSADPSTVTTAPLPAEGEPNNQNTLFLIIAGVFVLLLIIRKR